METQNVGRMTPYLTAYHFVLHNPPFFTHL